MSKAPTGWVTCTLGEVIKVKNGYAFPSQAFRKDGVPLVKQSNLDGNRVSLAKCVYLDPDWLTTKTDYILKQNDVLIGMSGSVGKLCIYDLTTPALQNQRTGKIVPLSKEQTEWRFVWEYLKTVEQQLLEKGKGMGVLNVSATDIESLLFPLPPLNEQRRIMAKLEEVLAKVDASQERLARIPVILKRFRQAVLAAACSGRLTADWREKYGFAESEELPEGWQRVSLRELCDGFQYGTSTKSEPSGKVPVIRMGNIQNGKIDWTNLAYTSDAVEIKKYRLNPGDVLFNRTNSPELVGKTAIYRGEQPAIFAGYLIKIKNRSELDSEYLNYCLNSFQAKKWCQQVKTDGVSQSNINAQKLADYEINFPPLPEQQEIVRRVESYFTLIDQLEARYHNAKTHIDRLTQSILAKAFRGELVPQDPNDEPASELLERIRTQGDVVASPKKKKEISDTTVPKKHRPRNTEPPPPPVVTTIEVKSLGTHARKIYRHMKRNREYSKDEIVVPIILSTGEWNSAIRELKAAGFVVQTGDKRGARYCKRY